MEKQDMKLLDEAKAAVLCYQDSEHDLEFGYDCSVNPEGVSDAELRRTVKVAENEMYFALSALDDDGIQVVLGQTQDRDHDGSTFMSTSLEEVQRWRSNHAGVLAAINDLPLEAALHWLSEASLSPIYEASYVEGHREQLRNAYFAEELSSTFVQAEMLAAKKHPRVADGEKPADRKKTSWHAATVQASIKEQRGFSGIGLMSFGAFLAVLMILWTTWDYSPASASDVNDIVSLSAGVPAAKTKVQEFLSQNPSPNKLELRKFQGSIDELLVLEAVKQVTGNPELKSASERSKDLEETQQAQRRVLEAKSFGEMNAAEIMDYFMFKAIDIFPVGVFLVVVCIGGMAIKRRFDPRYGL